MYRDLTAPLHLHIELTTSCTNNCIYCYNYQRHDDSPSIRMTTENIAILFEKISKSQIPNVTITGGEPLLEPDLLIQCIYECNKRNITCSINSNLVLLTEALLDRMQAAGNFSILASIASFDANMHDYIMQNNGAFDKTVAGAKLLHERKIPFCFNMVVTQQNANQIYETGLLVAQLGAHGFSATKASAPLGCLDFSAVRPSIEQVRQSLDSLLHIREATGINVNVLECYPLCFFDDLHTYRSFASRKCVAGIMFGAIGPEGGLRPCPQSNRIYGNAFTEEIGEIYARMAEWRTGELLPEKCRVCKYLNRCSGGCRCEAEGVGSITDDDPYARTEDDVTNFSSLVRDSAVVPPAGVIIPNDVLLRKESFGYILYRGSKHALIDDEGGDYIKLNIGNRIEFNSDSCLNLDDETKEMLISLVNRRVILPM